MRSLSSVALAAALASACGANPNPPVPPPSSAELSGGGVWVAYNLGCDAGCDQIRRGDRILAVDGEPVASGAEYDAANVARGAPVTLQVARYGGGAPVDVQLVARPHELPPARDVPPLLTVGAAALDRAPEWARLRLFGHAIPAMRLYRGEEPRGYVNGRELYRRGAVLFVWEMPWLLAQTRALWAELPGFYAQIQRHDPALQAIGVDTFFVFPSAEDSRGWRTDADPRVIDAPSGGENLKMAINEETRAHIRSELPPGTTDLVPLFLLESGDMDPNTLGLENPASDIREWLFDRIYAPVILIIDHRGIVRFHSRDFPIGPEETIEAAVQFALRDLGDPPAAAPNPAPVAPVEPAPAPSTVAPAG
jgi:hypothetical protein